MKIKFIKNIALTFCLGLICFCPIKESYAQDNTNSLSSWQGSSGSCEGAYQPSEVEKDNGLTPKTSGMFSDTILQKMHEFMQQIYLQLSKPLMIGHSLMCYAAKVNYTCIGFESVGCLMKLYDMNLLISGFLIYFVGIMMAMSIGMYFVDISFKLGFAMLFMPISIALWPFPPTKNKFQENLSIIIRNGMLFVLVAIGVSFAISLLSASLFDEKYGSDGERVFWEAIANKRTELLTESFAFYHFHFLVVAFGLIFAFKILASSVNDYLNYFFSDSVFGSESPMHHMGTQAIGMLKANTVDKAASFVRDVAKTQTGRALAGLGGGIAALGSSQGRKELAQSIKNKASTVKRVVTNPRQSFNSAMTSLEENTKSALKSGAKGIVNSALLLTPGKDSWRQKLEKQADKFIDDTVDRGIKENAKRGIVKAATLAYNLNEATNFTPENKMSEKDMRNQLSSIKKDINDKYVNPIKTIAKIYAQPITDGINNVKDALGKATAEAKTDTNVYNDIQGWSKNPQNAVTTEQMRSVLSEGKSKLAQATKEAWDSADQAPISLQPSALLSAPFKAMKGIGNGITHPIDSIEKLANGWNDIKKAKEDKVILKKTGQIVMRIGMRSVKGTGQDIKKVAEGTASIFGNMLKDFGKSMQNNGDSGNRGWTSFQDMHEAEERKKEAAQNERDFYNGIDKDNDE